MIRHLSVILAGEQQCEIELNCGKKEQFPDKREDIYISITIFIFKEAKKRQK